MYYGCIYCITNLVNEKKYIGLTTRSVSERFKEHAKADSYIGNALRKYGLENFVIEELEYADTKKELCDKEIHWIKEYATFKHGYNLTVGGEGVDRDDSIVINLTEEQNRFIDYVYKENGKDIDVNNRYDMIKAVLINIMERYLNAKKLSDKKAAAKFINKLKPEYKRSIKDANVININELISYLK